MCQEEIPFKKRDGKHYFEIVGTFELSKGNKANNLVLCLVCATQYREFVVRESGNASVCNRRYFTVKIMK